MRLQCRGNSGAALPTSVLEASGNTSSSRFNVTVGEQYDARAMALWTYGLGVLIVDDTGRPNWKPLDLFVVRDGSLPDNWEFAVVNQREPVLALWGYPSLIHDPRHHDDLIDRKISAFQRFLGESGADRDRRLHTPQ